MITQALMRACSHPAADDAAAGEQEPPRREPAAPTREIEDFAALAAVAMGADRLAVFAGTPGHWRRLATHGQPWPEDTEASVLLSHGAWHTGTMVHARAMDSDPLARAWPQPHQSWCVRLEDSHHTPVGLMLAAVDGSRMLSQVQLEFAARVAGHLIERTRLRRSSRIVSQFVQAGFDGMLVVDASGHVEFANRAAEQMFCVGGRAMRRMPLSVLFPMHLQIDPPAAEEWLCSGSGRILLRTGVPGGNVRLIEATRCNWWLEDGRGSALVLRDVTDLHQQQLHLQRLGEIDVLTGLPNRSALLEMLHRTLLKAVDGCTLVLLDIDGFRHVNDTLGHAAGDAVLRETAHRVQALLPAQAWLARTAGDEFAIVMHGLDNARVEALVDQALVAVARRMEFEGQPVHVTASLGIACEAGLESGDAGALLGRADLALERAKARGGDQSMHYAPGMHQQAIERRELVLELRRAHEKGEFELHYQPQVDLETGLTVGAEALLRWRHPERGLLSPVHFIDVLASSHLAADVGRWIVQRACADAARWQPVGGREVALAVNLFPVQVDDAGLPDVLDNALADSGLDPSRLELEITESIALRPDDAPARTLARLRERGVRLAFDDFGTGYASLSLLQRFAIDRVKIDRSFVREMHDKGRDAAIVRALVLVSRDLDLDVLAEGVETRVQADMLKQLGCGSAQGWLYAPALEPDAFERWLEAQASGSVAAEALAGVPCRG